MGKKNTLKKFIASCKYRILARKKWSNNDNKKFYQNMPLEIFYQTAIQGGLDTGIDIKNLKEYIKNANSILEIGAGYGRVLSHILNLGYTGKLTAIERNQRFCQFLQSQFHNRANIICSDITDFKCNNKFDLILWMWAGICEFSKTEQTKIITHISKMLNKNGFLILDTIPVECSSINATALNPHDRIVKTSYGKDYCYLPSDEGIMQYAQQAGLIHHKNLIYYTNVDRQRNLNIFCFR